MNAKSSANTMPLVQEHRRERAGENILFNARTRSKLAKQGGDALSDLAQRDVDRAGRYPVPAEIGTGGELVPGEPDLRDTVKNPDYVTVDASRDRLALASGAGVLELALDASDTIDPKNSLEKMLAHQMAVLHRQMMRLSTRMEDLSVVRSDGFQQRNVEVCRLAGTVAPPSAGLPVRLHWLGVKLWQRRDAEIKRARSLLAVVDGVRPTVAENMRFYDPNQTRTRAA
jgi:hypothetical protein